MADNDLKARQAKATKEWDEMAGVWDKEAVSYRDSLASQLWDHVEFANQRRDLVVVDFGCGTGLLTEYLRTQVGKVVCIDASPAMMEKVFGKIRDCNWSNVEGYNTVLSEPDDQPDDVKDALENLKGCVDLIVATSVLSFVPDLQGTMLALKDLLKPGTGLLCHTDWCWHEECFPDGFSGEKARKVYRDAGLATKSTNTVTVKVEKEDVPVFLGVAAKL